MLSLWQIRSHSIWLFRFWQVSRDSHSRDRERVRRENEESLRAGWRKNEKSLIFVENATKSELLISFFTFEYDSFVRIIFFINCILAVSSTFLVLKAKVFLNIDCTDYSFIDQDLAQIICDKLDMCLVFLFQSRNVKGFDDQMFFIFIIHVLYSILIVQNHIEFIIFMLIISLNQHQIILEKLWMNSHEVMLNMQFDQLSFKFDACDHYDVFIFSFEFFFTIDFRRSSMQFFISFDSYERFAFSFAQKFYMSFTIENVSKKRKMTILKRFFSLNESLIRSNEKMFFVSISFSFFFIFSITFFFSFTSKVKFKISTNIDSYDKTLSFEFASFFFKFTKKIFQITRKNNINMISTTIYYYLIMKHVKNKNYEFFVMFFNDINKIFDYIESRMSIRFMLEINEIFTQKIILKQIERLLSSKFKNFFQTFDLNLAEQLSSHRVYDHKIELKKNSRTIKSRIYFMSYHKLLKLKKYLDENFRKDFITINSTLFASLVLFVFKFNDDFRFCVNYRKLNVIIKRNRYFISLIEKILTKIIDVKYFTKLNVIAIFNKFRMNSKNENFITFIIFLNFYKYKILFFDFTNDSINY